MRLFFDKRLKYFVTAPGQSAAATGAVVKSGDTEIVEIVVGKSSDPAGSPGLFEAQEWANEAFPTGTNIAIVAKAPGKYSDGEPLALAEEFTLASNVYTFSLNLNTDEINDELNRGDEAENDIASIAASFELSYQLGGSGGWQSSALPFALTINHDLYSGVEGNPNSANSPDAYLLRSNSIRHFRELDALVGGDSTDLDSIPTTTATLEELYSLVDESGDNPVYRVYRLEAGTDATDAPNIVRPDDYATTTNEKVFRLVNILDLTFPLETNGNQIRESKGADVASAATLTLGNDGNEFTVTGTTAITAIGTKGVGTRVSLVFADILTFTHHATDLILPTGANITTAAGDVAVMREYATGDWRCESYQRASGAALLDAVSISNVVEDTTPQLGGTLDTNGKQIRESKGADVSSAGTLTLGNDGNYFDVTGTTSITSIATKGVGTLIGIHFDAALTLTHHATDLILPGGANITTAAGDEAFFREYATGDWRCVSYTRASGAAHFVQIYMYSTVPSPVNGMVALISDSSTDPSNPQSFDWAMAAVSNSQWRYVGTGQLVNNV